MIKGVNTTSSEPFTNYYEVLEVSPKATQHEIYQSYQKIKKTYSLKNPDIFRNFTVEEVQQLAYLIEDAYATIGNQLMREIYDAKYAEAFAKKINTEELETSEHDDELSSVDTPSSKIEIEDTSAEIKLAKLSLEEASLEKQTAPATNANMGKTLFSDYEIDDNFETLIATQDYFDGIFLGKIRKYKKISIDDFSKKTCINTKYLYAIESNNYSALPVAVFTRGYIAQYCKLLSLDIDKAVNSFMKLFANGRE